MSEETPRSPSREEASREERLEQLERALEQDSANPGKDVRINSDGTTVVHTSGNVVVEPKGPTKAA